MDNNSIFAERLKEVRERRCLTQSELANAINSHVNVIWQYENNKRSPKLEVGVKIAKALNIDMDYLLGITDDDSMNMSSYHSLLSAVRQFLQDNAIEQRIKDEFYKQVTNFYWKVRE